MHKRALESALLFIGNQHAGEAITNDAHSGLDQHNCYFCVSSTSNLMQKWVSIINTILNRLNRTLSQHGFQSISAQWNAFSVLWHRLIENSTELWAASTRLDVLTQRMVGQRSANRLLTRLIWRGSRGSQNWFDFTQHTNIWWGMCVWELCCYWPIMWLLSFLLCWKNTKLGEVT